MGKIPAGFACAHHRIDAVMIEVNLIAFRRYVRIVGVHAAHHLAFHFLQPGDEQRVADARQHKGTVRHRSRSLQLQRIGLGNQPAARYPDPAAIKFGKGTRT